MAEKTEQYVSTEMPLYVRERTEGPGIVGGGKHGEIGVTAIVERQKSAAKYCKGVGYRECVSCDRCAQCIEMRGFSSHGKERVTGLLCINGMFETTPWHTCNAGRRSSIGRKKVVYDMTNAPQDFIIGVGGDATLTYEPGVSSEEIAEAGKEMQRGMKYRGGSKYYKRADGREPDEAKGEMPKGLMN